MQIELLLEYTVVLVFGPQLNLKGKLRQVNLTKKIVKKQSVLISEKDLGLNPDMLCYPRLVPIKWRQSYLGLKAAVERLGSLHLSQGGIFYIPLAT